MIFVPRLVEYNVQVACQQLVSLKHVYELSHRLAFHGYLKKQDVFLTNKIHQNPVEVIRSYSANSYNF